MTDLFTATSDLERAARAYYAAGGHPRGASGILLIEGVRALRAPTEPCDCEEESEPLAEPFPGVTPHGRTMLAALTAGPVLTSELAARLGWRPAVVGAVGAALLRKRLVVRVETLWSRK